MKAYCSPLPGALVSRAMHRVTEALEKSLPEGWTLTKDPKAADLQIIHTIGPIPESVIQGREYSIIQYCHKTAPPMDWQRLWAEARSVWSYYDLPMPAGANFYYAPLGVDLATFKWVKSTRRVEVLTSGYVNGPGAEAIEIVANAALSTGRRVHHLGPSKIEGMRDRKEITWRSFQGVTDAQLRKLYSEVRFVSGLRHVEGFELPVLEGIACGAVGLVFDRPEMRKWYGNLPVVFLPEDERLEERLRELFAKDYWPVVTTEHIELLRTRFNWSAIAQGFWTKTLGEQAMEKSA